MLLKSVRLIACSILLCAPVSALANAQSGKANTVLQSCIQETRAPGSYAVETKDSVPVVLAASGSNPRHVRNLQDCIYDRYGVQFGERVATEVVTDERRVNFCQKIRDRRIRNSVLFAVGYAIGIGDSLRGAALIGAGAGVGYSAVRASQNYKNCLVNAQLQPGGLVSNVSCRGGQAVFQGGNRYCARY